jgi:hypothetical protein
VSAGGCGAQVDVTVLVWLGGSILGAAWGVAALWLATFCSEHALWMSLGCDGS